MKAIGGRSPCDSRLRSSTRWEWLRVTTMLVLAMALVPVTPVWAASNPTLGDITASPSDPIALDNLQPVVLTATFGDLDPDDTHYVIVNWDDGTTCEAHGIAPDTSIDEYCSIDNVGDTITASHRYTAPGVYAPSITVATEGQTTGGRKGKQYRYVVIYDDTKGHIKGSGGFDFDHQYTQIKTADGPAQFGFTVGYNANGTFRSNSRVRFMLYDNALNSVFDFASTSFNWMVISRPNALISGTGTISGVSYNFVLSIIDGGLQSPTGPDRFRIRITTTSGSLYYDNEFAPTPTRDIMLFDPTVAIGGGQIEIADAAGTASLGGSELIIVGNAPQEAIENIGLTSSLFMPLVSE